MAIEIPHRFYERLNSTQGIKKLNVIIIGTFNPGLPVLSKLTSQERVDFENIKKEARFASINSVLNFYDRPQNRFWKLMDVVNSPLLYEDGQYRKQNPVGLKFYKKMVHRQEVFQRQQAFCKERGILITDIVKVIRPKSFAGIYHKFPDTSIEKASPIFNTAEIIHVIKTHHPEKALINFNPFSNSIPVIGREIQSINQQFPELVYNSMSSTSGAAGFNYKQLIDDWGQHFSSKL